MNNVIKGSDLMLFTKSTTGSTYTSLANATNHSLTINAASLETSSKDSGKWTTKQTTKLDWSISTDNLYSTDTINGYQKLFDIMVSREPLEVAFALKSDISSDTAPVGGWLASTGGYSGKAVITSLTLNASDGDNATYSCTLEGSGALNKR